jgi:Putative zinc-finger
MTNNVHCEEFAERLADLLERDVDEATRAALESHALGCGDCGSLLADLRKLRIDASSLPELTASRDLWAGIAERIDAPVIPLRSGPSKFVRRWPQWASLVAAAVVLIALTSTSTYFLTVRKGSITPPPRTAANGPSVASDSVSHSNAQLAATVPAVPKVDSSAEVAHEAKRASSPSTARFASTKPSAEEVYTSEIARLRSIVERRRTQLDPVTISVIERNLKVIDDAIAQCRLALAKDPASRFLMESLNNALETKVKLLRTATMLPARS